ncbi:hypothetical protein HOLleu_04520 [Holothuria leucospilota]|uniref:Uncharacterized protein n=1 Tax=Holothuria leucospilota TaxID=206669 RepID=A0A9Q1CU34_HOLLE|nr:hypothetical protein HOLleu_04520 [Holothuria leucospilota]
MLTGILDEKDLKEIRSYEELVNRLYPPLEVPKIVFSVPDNVSHYVEVSREYEANYTKMLASPKDLAIYTDKVDEGLAKAKNFSDQIVDRVGSITKAIGDVFTFLLGGDAAAVISFLLGWPLVAFVALILNGYFFLPEFILWLIERRQRVKGYVPIQVY